MKVFVVAFIIIVIIFTVVAMNKLYKGSAKNIDSSNQISNYPDERRSIFPQLDQYLSQGLIMNIQDAKEIPGGGKIILDSMIFDFSSTFVFIRLQNISLSEGVNNGFNIVTLLDNIGNKYLPQGQITWKSGDKLWCAKFRSIHPKAQRLRLILGDIYKYRTLSNHSEEKTMRSPMGYSSRFSLSSTHKQSDSFDLPGAKIFLKGRWEFKMSIPQRDFSQIVKIIPLNKKFELEGHTISLEKLIITPTDTLIYMPGTAEVLNQISNEKGVYYLPMVVDVAGNQIPLAEIDQHLLNFKNIDIGQDKISTEGNLYNAGEIVKLNTENIEIRFFSMKGEVVEPKIITEKL